MTDTTTETKHFKMLSTQRGVREGEIHPVVFSEGKTYKLDDSLEEQFSGLDAIEPSTDEPAEPTSHDSNPDSAEETWNKPEPLNENVLDEDPAVLRHAEIPVEAVVAQNDAARAKGDMTPQAEQTLGRVDADAADEADQTEGGSDRAEADADDDAKTDADEAGPAKAKPAKKRK